MYRLRDAARAAKANAAGYSEPLHDHASTRASGHPTARDRVAPRERTFFTPREPESAVIGAARRPLIGPMPVVDVQDLLRWLLDGWKTIVALTIVGLLAGAAFGMLATPRYTAYTDLLVAPANLQVVKDDVYASSLQSDAQLLDIESRMRVLSSGNVLRRVAAKLNLKDDREFKPKPKLFDWRALIGTETAEDSDPLIPIIRELSERVAVSRQERSYMVTATVWTWDKDKSVRIANALVDAFREELAQGDAAGAGRAAQTLQDRLAELKSAVAAADDKVQAFKRDHNLQQSAAGQLVNTQSMAQINAKLLDAQTRQLEAASRYRELTQGRSTDIGGSSSVQSPTLTALRVQFAELKRQVDSMSLTYGPLHPALSNSRSQLEAIRREIADETNRILRAAKVDLDQANSVLKSLEADTATARNTVSGDDEASVQLRELERDAAAKSSLYQGFLVRAGEAAQREQVDATNIRVISPAVPPIRRSWPPRTVVTAGAGAFGGFALGCALVVAFAFAGAYRRSLAKA